MFENVKQGDEVRIHFAGSTQGLAMRVRYDGRGADGLHRLSTIGLMAGATLTATDSALGNGRRLSKVEVAK